MRGFATALATVFATGALVVALPVAAQSIADERRALDRARTARAAAAMRAEALDRAAVVARDDAERARAASAAVAARIQRAEAGIDAAEAESALATRLLRAQRTRLAAQQGPTIRLVAALHAMARRPLALALLERGSIDAIVRTHAVLAAIRPQIEARSAGLRAEVMRGRRLRAAAEAALGARRAAQADLQAQRRQLATLAARQRMAAQGFANGAMIEQDRAIAMGEEARDIADLLGRIDDAASVRARLEALPGPVMRPVPGQIAPTATAAVRPRIPAYRLPVVGTVVTGLGEVSATGIRARGLTIATRTGAQVVAPTTGRIAFAGPFRGYGRIIVIDHGGGWTTLLAGLASLDVAIGDTVDRGSPLGRAGDERPRITVELRRQGRPVDIARLAG